jgi:hypothetical protein
MSIMNEKELQMKSHDSDKVGWLHDHQGDYEQELHKYVE